jgi:hypothetical protein
LAEFFALLANRRLFFSPLASATESSQGGSGGGHKVTVQLFVAAPSRKMLISLTTIPARIDKLKRVLAALKLALLCDQDKIVLHIPAVSKRTGQPYVLPEFLKAEDPAILVNAVDEDYGPATKFIGCMNLATHDGIVIVVDDDAIYPKEVIHDLYHAQKRERDMFIHAVWVSWISARASFRS